MHPTYLSLFVYPYPDGFSITGQGVLALVFKSQQWVQYVSKPTFGPTYEFSVLNMAFLKRMRLRLEEGPKIRCDSEVFLGSRACIQVPFQKCSVLSLLCPLSSRTLIIVVNFTACCSKLGTKKAWEWQCSSERSHEQFRTILGHRI